MNKMYGQVIDEYIGNHFDLHKGQILTLRKSRQIGYYVVSRNFGGDKWKSMLVPTRHFNLMPEGWEPLIIPNVDNSLFEI